MHVIDRCNLARREHMGAVAMGMAGALWGIAGFLLLLGVAAARLSIPARAAFAYPFHWYHWLFLALVLVFFAYVKGHRAFQKGLSGMVVQRALALRRNPSVIRVTLAPLLCMGFFGAGFRIQTQMIALTAGMIAFVFLIRLIPQPWRGILDLGLVIAFGWGFLSALIMGAMAFLGRRKA
jgi:hypothetical protein